MFNHCTLTLISKTKKSGPSRQPARSGPGSGGFYFQPLFGGCPRFNLSSIPRQNGSLFQSPIPSAQESHPLPCRESDLNPGPKEGSVDRGAGIGAARFRTLLKNIRVPALRGPRSVHRFSGPSPARSADPRPGRRHAATLSADLSKRRDDFPAFRFAEYRERLPQEGMVGHWKGAGAAGEV